MSPHNTPREYTTLPEKRRFERLCERVRSSLTAAGVTTEDFLATIPEARNRVYARRYGKKPKGDVSRRRSRSHCPLIRKERE